MKTYKFIFESAKEFEYKGYDIQSTFDSYFSPFNGLALKYVYEDGKLVYKKPTTNSK